MSDNSGAKVLVCITGGVAAFKGAAVVSRLAQNGIRVQVTMTPAAERFVGEATLAALSGRPVVKDLFDPEFPLGAHIELARDYPLMCVVPATANFLAKAANGLADDLISTLYLCFTGPVLVAPAMNCEMWEKKAVQRNVNQLVEDGVHLVGPQSGWLSCRQQGMGRMAEPDEVVEAIAKMLRETQRKSS